jgi:hypothetical protein
MVVLTRYRRSRFCISTSLLGRRRPGCSVDEHMPMHQLPAYAGPISSTSVVESPRGLATTIKFTPALGDDVVSAVARGGRLSLRLGFIPITKSEDGDPLGAMIVADLGAQAGAVVAGHWGVAGRAESGWPGKPRPAQQSRDRGGGDGARASSLMTVAEASARPGDEFSQFVINVTAFEGSIWRSWVRGARSGAGPDRARCMRSLSLMGYTAGRPVNEDITRHPRRARRRAPGPRPRFVTSPFMRREKASSAYAPRGVSPEVRVIARCSGWKSGVSGDRPTALPGARCRRDGPGARHDQT